MSTESVVNQMLAARTPTEVAAAQATALAWLADHPDDFAVLSAGEQLAMMAGANAEIAAGRGDVPMGGRNA